MVRLLDLAVLGQGGVQDEVALSQRIVGAGPCRFHDPALAPFDRFGRPVLREPDPAMPGEQSSPGGTGIRAWDVLEFREGSPNATDRQREPPERPGLLGLLQGEASRRRRVVADQVSCRLERGIRQFRLVEVVADVADAFVDLGEFTAGDTAQPPTGRDGFLVGANGLHVGVNAEGPIGGPSTEHPGLVPALRREVMEGQRADFPVQRDARLGFDRLAYPVVEHATTPVGESLVSGVADQGVPESHGPGGLVRQEPTQPCPNLVVKLHVIAHGVRQQAWIEAGTQDGGVAQDRAVAGRQTVYLACDHRLDRVRQRIDAAGLANLFKQLEQEQRVPAGSSGDLVNLVARQRVVLGRRINDRHEGVGREWFEFQRDGLRHPGV